MPPKPPRNRVRTSSRRTTSPSSFRITPMFFFFLLMAASLFLSSSVHAFSTPTPPPFNQNQQQQQSQSSQPTVHEPRIPKTGPTLLGRSPPGFTPETDHGGILSDDSLARVAGNKPFRSLGPGGRVAIAGANAAEGNTLARLVTMKLFKQQLRPYLLVPSREKAPTGLGFDQYRGLTRYICDDETEDEKGAFPDEIEGLIMCSEKGYTAKQVREMLERTGEGLKRVVMLSSLGVNRRDDFMVKLRQFGINLDERHAAEQELMSAASARGFSYTLLRVGKLRGGGGEQGLGYEYYDKNPNPIEAKMEEDFDVGKRGFTLSYGDNIEGETGRILAAETIIKALSSDHVEDVAVAIVSEDGKTFPNFQIAPWDLF